MTLACNLGFLLWLNLDDPKQIVLQVLDFSLLDVPLVTLVAKFEPVW